MAKRILDEATRKALQGYTPFSVDASVEFIPELFSNSKLDKTLHPIFKVRCMKQNEIIQLKANYSSITKDDSTDNVTTMASNNSHITRACVLSWDNFFDSGSGEEIEYKSDTTGGVDKDLWAKIPQWIVNSISEYVRKISGLSAVNELSLK